jgi:hypothetical protein
VIRGSADIGAKQYGTGDLRVQKAGVADDAASQRWKGAVNALHSELYGVGAG